MKFVRSYVPIFNTVRIFNVDMIPLSFEPSSSRFHAQRHILCHFTFAWYGSVFNIFGLMQCHFFRSHVIAFGISFPPYN